MVVVVVAVTDVLVAVPVVVVDVTVVVVLVVVEPEGAEPLLPEAEAFKGTVVTRRTVVHSMIVVGFIEIRDLATRGRGGCVQSVY